MDYELIARLHSEGLADGEIAKAAATHHVVVRYWRNKAGLKANAPRPKPPAIVGVKTWTDERDELITKLWQEGLSASEIAMRVDRSVSRNAVIGRLHRLGVTRRMKQVSKQTRNRITVGRLIGNTKRIREAMKPKPFKMEKPSLARRMIRDLPTEPLPPVEELHIPLKERKSIATLEANDCRWPIGDPRDADFHFCGKHQAAGLPYCEYHARRAYAPPAVAKANHPERPTWQDTRTGRKGAVFLSGREKMKAY